MLDYEIHPRRELPALARLIHTNAASWRGVPFYYLRPAPDRKRIDYHLLLPASGSRPLCFEGPEEGSLVFLGPLGRSLEGFPAEAIVRTPDIAADPASALAALDSEIRAV